MKFIKVCESSFGNPTCIYHFLNVYDIVSIRFEEFFDNNKFIITDSLGREFLAVYKDDISSLLGDLV